MEVREYIRRFVATEYEPIFVRLMREWDGQPNMLGAFYDEDVLKMKLDEAKELWK